MKLLLHACCAPCSGAIVEALLGEGIIPTMYYCNPNIFPEEEYVKRRDECAGYAAECGIEMVEAEYTHSVWLQCVASLENEPERGARCLKCFRHRLLAAAQYAAFHGFDTLSTTLASSRWKSLEQVNAAGRWAVDRVNAADAIPHNQLQWWDRNWRKGGLQERRNQIIREHNFYNQLYCGCEFSLGKSQ